MKEMGCHTLVEDVLLDILTPNGIVNPRRSDMLLIRTEKRRLLILSLTRSHKSSWESYFTMEETVLNYCSPFIAKAGHIYTHCTANHH